MSVHGEFDRYLEATLSALRASGQPHLIARANEIEATAMRNDVPLEARARSVLDGPLTARRSEGAAGSAGSDLVEATEALIEISRVILGS